MPHLPTDNIANNTSKCLAVILAFAALHLAYINTPFVNLEWAYRQGSLYFLNGNEKALADYLAYQANPLTFSYFSSWLAALFGPDQYFPYRLLALGGGILLLAALLRHNNPFLLLVVALNPLIWIYSGRGYSELLAVGLMMLAFESLHSSAGKSVFGSLAGMVKYHAWPVLLLQAGLQWLQRFYHSGFRDWRNQDLAIIAIILGCAIGFLYLYYLATGIWIYPDRFSAEMTGFTISNTLNNFFGYGFFLSGMFFLTLPFHFTREAWPQKAGIFGLSMVFALLNTNLGEMDFGSLELLLGSNIILAIKAIGFWNFLLCCQHFYQEPRTRTLLLTVLLYIAVLSVTRPAQRYLIFVIPLWAILICQGMALHRLVWYGYVACLIPLNMFVSLYQVSNARAAWNLAEWAEENRLVVDLGAIHPHVGNTGIHVSGSSYLVSIGDPDGENVMHSEDISVFGVRLRSYILTDSGS